MKKLVYSWQMPSFFMVNSGKFMNNLSMSLQYALRILKKT